MTTPPPGMSPSPQRSDLLEILVEASELVSRQSLDLDRLLHGLAELVRKVIDYQLFAVLLRSGDSSLRMRFAIGYSEDTVRQLRIEIGEGITGEAAETMRTVVVQDVRQDPRYLMSIDAVRSEIAVPLVARGKLVGVIDLQSTERDGFDEASRSVLELIASRFSLAIEAARLHQATLRQNRVLRTLSRIAQQFTQILHLDDLLKKVASLIRGVIPYDALTILMLEEDGQVLKHYFGVRFDQRVQWDNIPIGKGIVGAAAKEKKPILVRDTEQDSRYLAMFEEIRSEAAVPLMVKNEVIGVINLESEEVGAFTPNDLRMLNSLAPQIAIAVENARLYEEVARHKARMETDLAAARVLQQHMLSSVRPEFEGIEIAARNDSAEEVTGDLYDFFPFPGEHLGILIGDVSGKGAAAALYAALAGGILRNLARPDLSPAELLALANEALLARKVETRYLTALYAQWYPQTSRLVVANAGQPRPIARRDGKVEALPVAGIPLGLLPGSTYEVAEFTMGAGDLLVIVSDGITETMSPSNQEYDENCLIRVMKAHPAASAEEMIEAIFEDLKEFSATPGQVDDRTVIAARFTGASRA